MSYRRDHPQPVLTKDMSVPDDLSRMFEGAVVALLRDNNDDSVAVRYKILHGMDRCGFDSETYHSEAASLIHTCKARYLRAVKEGPKFNDDSDEPCKPLTGGSFLYEDEFEDESDDHALDHILGDSEDEPEQDTEDKDLFDQDTKNSVTTDDVSGLTKLGSNTTDYEYEGPNVGILECFPNQFVDNKYRVTLDFPEFTSLCPKTGQPDFGSIRVMYVPHMKCIESKSFKMYMFSWRTEGCFMESITNRILDDLVTACEPLLCRVEGLFNARGGVAITVEAEYNMAEGSV